MNRVYFDNAATTPMTPEVIAVMLEVMEKYFGNPSSIHAKGRECKTLIEKARKHIAELLHLAPAEIFFTSGGTESNNTIIQRSIADLGVNHIITSPIEHHAVLHPVIEIEKSSKVKVSFVKLGENGHIDLSDLEKILDQNKNDTVLVSLMHANNEIGNLTDIYAVGDLCKNYKAYFHTDTVQTIGHLPVDLKKASVHFASASAHKLNGPKGIGFLYLDQDVKIKNFIHGGSQERNLRGGTENIYGICGFEKAISIAFNEMQAQEKHISALKKQLVSSLRQNFPEIEFNGDVDGNSLFTIVNTTFPDNDMADMLLFNLDINGICVSGGSACSSGSNTGSHVLAALRNETSKSASIRFSLGKYNTPQEVDFVVDQLKKVFKKDIV